MKLTSYLAAFFSFFASISLAQSFTSEREKVAYCMGIVLADELKGGDFTSADKAIIMKAIDDYFNNQSSVDLNTAKKIASNYRKVVYGKIGQDFLAKNGQRSGVITLPSGLQYEVLKTVPEGGPKPKLADRIKVHYHGTTIDGIVFDSSVDRGVPASIKLTQVIKGWQEGLQMMSVGEKWKLFIPFNLAYGDRGSNGIAPYSVLIFEVELLGIDEAK